MALVFQGILPLILALGQVQPLTATFPDQFGGESRFEDHGGEPAVVIVVSAQRLRKIKKWEVALRERYEDLRIVRIADVPRADPPPAYEDVASRLRARVPEDLAVWIDLEGLWAAEFELDTSRPNLLVIDSEGNLTASVSGRYAPGPFEELARSIDRVLEDS